MHRVNVMQHWAVGFIDYYNGAASAVIWPGLQNSNLGLDLQCYRHLSTLLKLQYQANRKVHRDISASARLKQILTGVNNLAVSRNVV